ncbi:MAG: hypothetical protein CMM50_10955 [Rhodospirillaceae bacterium]|nr:hypothetical protein [Rhodospirillaceae bacterium]
MAWGRAVAVAAAALVLAAGTTVPDRTAGDGWFEMTFDDKAPNHWTIGSDDAVEIRSEDSVSLLYRLVEVDLAATPCLTWQWRVDTAPPASDLARKGKDDRAVAVYVSFPFDPDNASLWETLKRPFVEAVRGSDAPGRVISYVWGGIRDRGQTLVSPYLGAAGILKILRPVPEPHGEWVTETVAVDRDYRAAFDAPAPNPIQIAVSADSDDTKSASHAWVRGIAFKACGAEQALKN